MKKCSSLTFGDLTENLGYVKVIWNGICIYDDELGDESPEHFHDVQEKYNNKIVYEMNIKIVRFHHCILNIKGEE